MARNTKAGKRNSSAQKSKPKVRLTVVSEKKHVDKASKSASNPKDGEEITGSTRTTRSHAHDEDLELHHPLEPRELICLEQASSEGTYKKIEKETLKCEGVAEIWDVLLNRLRDPQEVEMRTALMDSIKITGNREAAQQRIDEMLQHNPPNLALVVYNARADSMATYLQDPYLVLVCSELAKALDAAIGKSDDSIFNGSDGYQCQLSACARTSSDSQQTHTPMDLAVVVRLRFLVFISLFHGLAHCAQRVVDSKSNSDPALAYLDFEGENVDEPEGTGDQASVRRED
ncbi:hypothetical protein H0H81_005338 [Sphagnurus paluster]|uniref:Uncharacterized protein n=1 Tax=Sphagnurus paluster TaxID=117069 RepID=A0A9P7K239_9AGAR|nr:hypothetical protein H0H81_005338 [Sphagnurus paluster]